MHHSAGLGVGVEADIQDSIVEDGQGSGIVVEPAGKATISGTKVRRYVQSGVHVEGEATIKDSSITGNVRSGVIAWKADGLCKAICTVGENVDCSGNNTGNTAIDADFCARQGGTFPGLPDHLVLFN